MTGFLIPEFDQLRNPFSRIYTNRGAGGMDGYAGLLFEKFIATYK